MIKRISLAVPRRARIQGSWTLASLKSRLESILKKRGEDSGLRRAIVKSPRVDDAFHWRALRVSFESQGEHPRGRTNKRKDPNVYEPEYETVSVQWA